VERDERIPRVEPLTPEVPPEEVSPEEMAAQQVVELPEREALSVASSTLALTVGTAVHAGLLPVG